jgi:hypothetical protein
MAVPDHRDDVAAAAARYPDAWGHAHTGGPRTEEFIRLLARDLHAINPRFGLNGKRGNPGDISDDALCYRGEGDQFDPTNGNSPVTVIDVIKDAGWLPGFPDPSPAWGTFPGNVHAGAWVQPDSAPVEPPLVELPAPPVPPAPVPPVDTELHNRIAMIQTAMSFLINQIAAQRNDIEVLHRQLANTYDQLANARLEVQDVRKALERPLTLEAGGRAFGVPVNIKGTVKP